MDQKLLLFDINYCKWFKSAYVGVQVLSKLFCAEVCDDTRMPALNVAEDVPPVFMALPYATSAG